MKRGLLAGAVVALALGVNANADFAVSADSYTFGSPVTNSSHGFEFNLSTTITISALGVIDRGLDGLVERHDVSIYRSSDQSLVARVTVGNGTSAPLIDGYRYANLGGPIQLTPGDYVIASHHQTGADNVGTSATNRVMGDGITWLRPRWGIGNDWTENTFSGERYGGNFMYVIPAPGALALLGFAGIATRRRRRTA